MHRCRVVGGALLVAAIVVLAASGSATAQTDTTTSTTTTKSTRPCAVADTLKDAGQPEAALREYLRVLRRDATEQCARRGLEALQPPPAAPAPDPCRVAKTLDDAGSEEAAREVLEEAAKKGTEGDPPGCVAEELEGLQNKPLKTQISDFFTDDDNYPWFLAVGILALGLLVFRYVRKPQLRFATIGDPPGDPKCGAAVSALTAATFRRQRGELEDPPALDHVDEFQDFATAMDGLKDVSPKLGSAAALVALFEKVVRRKQYTVSGQLHWGAARGAGITAQLSKHNRVQDADTLWSDRPARPTATEDDYAKLAVPAAAWTLHQLAARTKNASSMTTSSAVSYAWLVAGQDAIDRGDNLEGLACYENAVITHTGHVRARVAWALTYSELVADDDAALLVFSNALADLEVAIGPP